MDQKLPLEACAHAALNSIAVADISEPFDGGVSGQPTGRPAAVPVSGEHRRGAVAALWPTWGENRRWHAA
jgi:hypothetical protein